MAEPFLHCYEYPHPAPAVTTDVVLCCFTIRDGRLQLLLIRCAGEPFNNHWALPGGFLHIDKDLEDCAMRELEEETGVSGVYVKQLRTYERPGRDPRERVISIAYYALAPSERLTLEESWHWRGRSSIRASSGRRGSTARYSTWKPKRQASAIQASAASSTM